MPLTAIEARFASLEVTNRELAAEIHALSAGIVNVQDLQRDQQRQKRLLHILAVVGLIAIVVAAAFVYVRAVQLTQESRHRSYNACTERNSSNRVFILGMAQLGDTEDDPAQAAIYRNLRQQLDRAQINCDRFR